MFRDLETFHKLVREYCMGKDEEVKSAKHSSPSKDTIEAKESIIEEVDKTGSAEEDMVADAYQQSKSKTSPKKQSFKIKHNTFII